MKITIALQTSPRTFTGEVIKFFTGSKYDHVELIIKDKWISSSPKQGGVKIKPLKPLKESYDYFDIEVDGRRLKRVMNFIYSQEGTDYDYLGVFFVWVNRIQSEDKWFCSEIVSEIMKKFRVEGFRDVIPNTQTPEDIYRIIT